MAVAQKFDPEITEGPISKAVWNLAWPTMLPNITAGLQGIVDHTLVGHDVGFTGNAAIGVSWQIFLDVIVFVGSVPNSAEGQAVHSVGYTQLSSLITWTSVGLMAAAATVSGQNPGAGKARAHPECAAHERDVWSVPRREHRLAVHFHPRAASRRVRSRATDGARARE